MLLMTTAPRRTTVAAAPTLLNSEPVAQQWHGRDSGATGAPVVVPAAGCRDAWDSRETVRAILPAWDRGGTVPAWAE